MVRPTDPADLPIVLAAVRDLAGVEPEVESGVVTAHVTDPAVLPAVVRRLDDAEVTLAELALRDASLDEVFLSLTGHRATDDSPVAERIPA